MNDLTNLTIYEIADRIYRNWKNVYFGAKPYLDAMMSLTTIDDMYICESGRSIVTYFLSNASQFKGEEARLIKAELNRRLKG